MEAGLDSAAVTTVSIVVGIWLVIVVGCCVIIVDQNSFSVAFHVSAEVLPVFLLVAFPVAFPVATEVFPDAFAVAFPVLFPVLSVAFPVSAEVLPDAFHVACQVSLEVLPDGCEEGNKVRVCVVG